MNNQNIAICGLRYGKTKAQAEEIKKYIEENSLTEIKITILDSESKQKLDKIKEYADDKREGFNEDIRDYLDDNLIGNEDKVNKLREFRSWFIDILSIIGGE